MSHKMVELETQLKLAIAMRDPDVIQSIRDDIQDLKDEQFMEKINASSQRDTSTNRASH